MDNTPRENNSEDAVPDFQRPAAQPARKPRQRPTVEGINSPRGIKEPVVKISLTPQEEDLVSEIDSPKSAGVGEAKSNQKILPQSLIDRIERRHTHYKAIFSIFIILLALVAGAYEFYIKYIDLHIPSLRTGMYSQNSQQDNGLSSSTTPQDGQSASGTDLSLTASSTAANASSTMANASSTEAATTAVSTPTPIPLPQLTVNSTPTGYLNVRDQPSLSGNVISQVHPGESYGYSQTQNGWYLITLTSGQTGWVSGQYVTPQ